MVSAPSFSLEIFPPNPQSKVATLYDTLDGLEGVKPDFISVTYGTGNKVVDQTARIAHTIVHEYQLEAVAHLTALYESKATIDHTLEAYVEAGVSAVLALRGDEKPGQKPCGDFTYASDLVAYIREQYPSLTLMGACYPEGHPQAQSLVEDVEHLRIKVDNGVEHLISQLFFDNDDFYRFLDRTGKAGINVPIHAGIMPIIQARSLYRMTHLCRARIPARIEHMLDAWADKPQSLRQAGIAYACEQIADLRAQGVKHVHLYTMNRPCIARKIWSNVSELF